MPIFYKLLKANMAAIGFISIFTLGYSLWVFAPGVPVILSANYIIKAHTWFLSIVLIAAFLND